MLTKGGARPGDALVLTKPLGFGVTSTALKRGQADPVDIDEMVRWMGRLNRDAARLASELSLRGGTDVTGFGLLGHGLEMAEASGVNLLIRAGDVPYTASARKYAGMGAFAGGSLDNRQFFGPRVAFEPALSEQEEMLLFDAQTSGGLLLAVPAAQLSAFLARAGEIDQPAWIIGEVCPGAGIKVM
jgi:selenide,water dikinase